MSTKNNLTFGTLEPFESLKKAIEQPADTVLQKIFVSGLKGRGGAGFLTGMKWKFAANTKNDIKYVVCNADEGEPGTFKDRVILTDYASTVFEGMAICGLVIGSTRGLLYLRAEYSYLRKNIEDILSEMRSKNILGKNILGHAGFDFDIEIRMGAGAYICGEESALIESMEGRRGEPRNRPPFPVVEGYLGKPTVVNNVETFAWVSTIMQKGPEWFHGIGTEYSKGPKLFSVSGDCEHPGVYEFPLGITIDELLKKVGGKDAKAVQVGGASGVCVPAKHFDRVISFEDATTGGAIIVFGQQRDMRRVAINFMEFFVHESCGQCTPCRMGNAKILDGLRQAEAGQLTVRHLKNLMALSETMALTSKCGGGQSSTNAFMSIVQHFQNEIIG